MRRLEQFLNHLDQKITAHDEHIKRIREEKADRAQQFFFESGFPKLISDLILEHPEVTDLGQIQPRATKRRLFAWEKDVFKVDEGNYLQVLRIGDPETTFPSYAPFPLNMVNPAAAGLDMRIRKIKTWLIGIEVRSNGDIITHGGPLGKTELSKQTWIDSLDAQREALGKAYKHPKRVINFGDYGICH